MKLFQLERNEDFSGVSGTGVVAEGIEWDDGMCELHWICGKVKSTTHYLSIEEVIEIHGHEGRTTVRWIGEVNVIRER